jgi:hypothetical protein
VITTVDELQLIDDDIPILPDAGRAPGAVAARWLTSDLTLD